MKVEFGGGFSLIQLIGENWVLHLGVLPHPEEHVVFRYRGHEEYEHVYRRWLWGPGTEQYDRCLDYWGLGPIFFFVKDPWS